MVVSESAEGSEVSSFVFPLTDSKRLRLRWRVVRFLPAGWTAGLTLK
jgi:hypothetical protein